MRNHRGPPDEQAPRRRHHGGARPRVGAAHAVGEGAGRLLEAQPAILLLEAWRERGEAAVLRHGDERARVERGERAQQDARADLGEPRGQLTRRLLGTDRRGLSEQHVARVHARVHPKRRDAALRLSADDRPGDGARPAIAREERGVNVDRPARGRVEHRLRQDLAERRDHRDVGGERGQARRPLGIAQPRRLEHGDPGVLRPLLDGRCREALPAPRRTIGLSDDGHDVMAGEESVECGAREVRRAVEDDPHARDRLRARRRGGGAPRARALPSGFSS